MALRTRHFAGSIDFSPLSRAQIHGIKVQRARISGFAVEGESQMLRRKFFKVMTVATTASALTPLEAVPATPKKIVTYHVRGFSCVTCATGLDTLLAKQNGIGSSSSTYPESLATIGFDPDQISEQQIKDFISSFGFTVDEPSRPGPEPTK
jgi:copper chaperone CopZ